MKALQTITADKLQEKDLGELKFVIDKLLPVGLNLLAGSPKVGKSWFSLWLSLQVASGLPVFDFKTTSGTVLYLALEDSELRLKNRMNEITDVAPSNLHFCNTKVSLGGELESHIQNFILENPDTNLVIIDTLQMIRNSTESNYANDYTDLLSLKEIAYQYNISILLIHHFRKQKDTDTFNQITGSTGLQGVVDSMFTLSPVTRGDKTISMCCVGRDIEPRELEISRTDEQEWIKLSDSNEISNIKDFNFIKTVQSFIKEHKKFYGTPTELSSHLESFSDDNYSNKVITKFINKLENNFQKLGIIVKTKRTGTARLIEIFTLSDENDVKASA